MRLDIAGVTLHVISVSLHVIDVILHVASMILEVVEVILHFISMRLQIIDVSLHLVSLRLRAIRLIFAISICFNQILGILFDFVFSETAKPEGGGAFLLSGNNKTLRGRKQVLISNFKKIIP
jgi:hypothetical protein